MRNAIIAFILLSACAPVAPTISHSNGDEALRITRVAATMAYDQRKAFLARHGLYQDADGDWRTFDAGGAR